ncbi:MAG TPA: glycosyltransferase family 2 protein [Candidatus Ozemobacteraceae bacterium]|nr:glycosyltransferase family 2 protein [Candidatus Ozemobacteraceae bacterium]
MHHTPSPDTHTTIIVALLNFNSWRHTIECLESLFRMVPPSGGFRVIVCDNASSDDSMSHIISWAEGHEAAEIAQSQVPKPIRWKCLTRKQAESGGEPSDADFRLLLVQTGENLGYAGGNNVALAYALARPEVEFVWVLNNDTIVEPLALKLLHERAVASDHPGICGSTIIYHSHPDMVQAYAGGTYEPWLARPINLGIGRPVREKPDVTEIESTLQFVVGVSALVSRSFLEKVGVMQTDYFLYFEEIDWALRARGRFKLGYAPGSIVYHKDGGSIGSHRESRQKSLLSELYFVRSAIRFTCRFFPFALPTVYAGLFLKILFRLRYGLWMRAWLIFAQLFLSWSRHDRLRPV